KHQVTARGDHLQLSIEDGGAEAVAEEVTAPPVAAVETLCVAAADLAHADTEVRCAHLDDELEAIDEHAVGVEAPAIEVRLPAEEPQEGVHVELVVEELNLAERAGRDVVDGAGEVDAWTTGHVSRLGAGAPTRKRLSHFRDTDVTMARKSGPSGERRHVEQSQKKEMAEALRGDRERARKRWEEEGLKPVFEVVEPSQPE